MPFTARPQRLLALVALLVVGLCAWTASAARASTSQISIMEPGPSVLSDPTDTMHTLLLLGVNSVRLNLNWDDIAPDPGSTKAPKHFNASNSSAYPAGRFAPYDAAIEAAHADGITVDIDVAGATPLWALAPGHPAGAGGSWAPTDSAYKAFYEAVAGRYNGHYRPPGATAALPDVTTWAVWNEANYTASLKPQSINPHNTPASPRIYRGLADAAWSALKATGHGHDHVLLGELTPRGTGPSGLYPVSFLQWLYCLSPKYQELRGTAASAIGCPTNAEGSRRFRSQNPVLFAATGISVHPYSDWYPPNTEKYVGCLHNALCASLGDIGDLVTAASKVQRAYGSHLTPAVYSTEYGYKTSPPLPAHFHNGKTNYYNVSLNTAAAWINWAEYLSYKNPQVASYDQYLLVDPQSTKYNGHQPYASGLETWDDHYKPSYYAFRVPLYLPHPSFSAGQYIEVWGAARPAPAAAAESPGTSQTVEVQFEPEGSSTFTTVSTVPITNKEGYIDTHISFPGSGTVRLAYTYPAADLMLAPGYTVFSRLVSVTQS
jgi:hypothetical protein